MTPSQCKIMDKRPITATNCFSITTTNFLRRNHANAGCNLDYAVSLSVQTDGTLSGRAAARRQLEAKLLPAVEELLRERPFHEIGLEEVLSRSAVPKSIFITTFVTKRIY